MTTTYGIISDIHGADIRLVNVAFGVLDDLGVDKYILNGDLVGDRNGKIDEMNYLANVLNMAGSSGKDVIALEGSHECVPIWETVFDAMRMKHSNIIDALEDPKIETEDHDLIFIPGSDWHAGNAAENGGYHFSNDIMETGTYSDGENQIGITNLNSLKDLVTRPEQTVVFSHVPRRFDNIQIGVDMAYFAERLDGKGLMPGVVLEGMIRQQLGDVPQATIENAALQNGYVLKRESRGNEDLAKVYGEAGVTKNVTGHFHESVHRAHDASCNPVEEGTPTQELFWNASYLDDMKVGLLTVDGANVSYRNVNLKDYLRQK